jgi:hypothetical protein
MKRAISSAKSRSRSKGSKTTSGKKTPAKRSAVKTRPRKSAKPTSKVPTIPRSGSLRERIAAAKRIEKMDRPKAAPKTGKSGSQMTERLAAATASTSRSQRNSDFPNTYITEIFVRLEDPDHSVTLTWTGPNASAQAAGPFRSSPGAGLRGLNCNELATSKRSGSTCTPKGTFTVTGFASRLNSHPEATDVTWFVPARGIALHYYPSVPKYAASHGCVRLESRRIAQLIQNNSRAGITQVVVDGTWTKPPHQW